MKTKTKKTFRILLLENDSESADARKGYIESSDADEYRYKVDVAHTEKAARQLIQKHRFHFLLADFLLFGGDTRMVPITAADVDKPEKRFQGG